MNPVLDLLAVRLEGNKMYGYSPKLPLVKDKIDGLYSMNKTALESIKQDLRMLLLTNPGERIMNPDYGVGLRQLLFSQNTEGLKEEISSRVSIQVGKYLSFVKIQQINFGQENDADLNALYFSVIYYIPSMNINDELNLSLNAN